MTWIAIAAALATVACDGGAQRRQRPIFAAVPVDRLHAEVSLQIERVPVDGTPRGTQVKVVLAIDRRQGMAARFETNDGWVELVCVAGRAWTTYPRGCHVEQSCDAAVKSWFDIGWGYDELARFILGEIPTNPAWKVSHARDSRYASQPVTSRIVSRAGYPRAYISWGSDVPANVDLAPALTRAQATPPCP